MIQNKINNLTGIYSETCSMLCGHFPNVMQVKPLPLPDLVPYQKKSE